MVREIGAAARRPSTVHSHLARLQTTRFLRRDPSRPRHRGPLRRHLRCCGRPWSGASRALVGDVAAGTDVSPRRTSPRPSRYRHNFTGNGESSLLRVRGGSMIESRASRDGDYPGGAAPQPTAESAARCAWSSPATRRRSETSDRPGDRRPRASQPGLLPINSHPTRYTCTVGFSPSCASGHRPGKTPRAAKRPLRGALSSLRRSSPSQAHRTPRRLTRP